jgi:hypothetical protein
MGFGSAAEEGNATMANYTCHCFKATSLRMIRVPDQYEGLVAHITREMVNDDEDQSQMLANIYLSADEAGREVLDQAFICLCGWSLKTLMQQVDHQGKRERRGDREVG